jgi:hypothetical protein
LELSEEEIDPDLQQLTSEELEKALYEMLAVET